MRKYLLLIFMSLLFFCVSPRIPVDTPPESGGGEKCDLSLSEIKESYPYFLNGIWADGEYMDGEIYYSLPNFPHLDYKSQPLDRIYSHAEITYLMEAAPELFDGLYRNGEINTGRIVYDHPIYP